MDSKQKIEISGDRESPIEVHVPTLKKPLIEVWLLPITLAIVTGLTASALSAISWNSDIEQRTEQNRTLVQSPNASLSSGFAEISTDQIVTQSIIEQIISGEPDSRSELLRLLAEFDEKVAQQLSEFYLSELDLKQRLAVCTRQKIEQAQSIEISEKTLSLDVGKGRLLACRTKDKSDQVSIGLPGIGQEIFGPPECSIVSAHTRDRAWIRFCGMESGVPTLRAEVWGEGCVRGNSAVFKITQAYRKIVTRQQLSEIEKECALRESKH